MRHDWIIDVLGDLRAYALANSLPGIAAKADETLAVARVEVSLTPSAPQDPVAPSSAPHPLPPR
jgi:hypothetical protein